MLVNGALLEQDGERQSQQRGIDLETEAGRGDRMQVLHAHALQDTVGGLNGVAIGAHLGALGVGELLFHALVGLGDKPEARAKQ